MFQEVLGLFAKSHELEWKGKLALKVSVVSSTSWSHADGAMGDVRLDTALGAWAYGSDADVGTGDMITTAK